ncbi:MAG: cupin domain-containing protein [Candidatus Kapaibacterium sp.]
MAKETDKMIIAKTADLAGLADYQDSSIISRTLVNKNKGTITLFAFDKGQSLSEHTAPFDALVQILDGTAEITINGEKHDVTAGEIILMPANDPHAVIANEKFKMLLTMIKA